MATKALRTKDDPQWAETVKKVRASRAKHQKKFSQLTSVEKDEILGELALKFGLVAPE